VLANGGNSYLNFGHLTTGYTLAETGSNLVGAGNRFQFFAEVPILGWSSTVQMSNDTDTRVVAARIGKSTNQSIPDSSLTKVTFTSGANNQFDTHSAFDFTNNRYVVPVSGFYRVTSLVSWAASGTGSRALRLFKNGAIHIELYNGLAGSGETRLNGSALVQCNAGDYLEVYGAQTSGGPLNITGLNGPDFNYVLFERLSGPSAIAASETVAARWVNTAGTGVTTNIASYPAAVIPFASIDSGAFDTHGMASGSGTTWKVTAPVSGKYVLTANMEVVAGAGALSFQFYKNGTTVVSWFRSYESGTNTTWVSGSSTVSLLAGDYIQILAATSVAQTLGTSVGQNVFTMTRVGN
jgi:hypothetical protein